jgi:hypothetical protein
VAAQARHKRVSDDIQADRASSATVAPSTSSWPQNTRTPPYPSRHHSTYSIVVPHQSYWLQHSVPGHMLPLCDGPHCCCALTAANSARATQTDTRILPQANNVYRRPAHAPVRVFGSLCAWQECLMMAEARRCLAALRRGAGLRRVVLLLLFRPLRCRRRLLSLALPRRLRRRQRKKRRPRKTSWSGVCELPAPCVVTALHVDFYRCCTP